MITQEELKKIISYDPETGEFKWLKKRPGARKNGIVGSVNIQGYVYTSIKRERWNCHRLAFLYMTGVVPKYVDHINGIRNDNRWCNLREATQSQNLMNRKVGSNNKSGIKGVCVGRHPCEWRAYVTAGGKQVYLGRFDNVEDAKNAVSLARGNLHGEFCNHG